MAAASAAEESAVVYAVVGSIDWSACGREISKIVSHVMKCSWHVNRDTQLKDL